MPSEQQHPNQEAAIKALENLRLRLLDLTARNRLINFKHTKKGSLRIIDELPDQLVETLLAETEMRFLPVPEPTREELVAEGYKDPTAEEWANRLGLETSYEVPKPLAEKADGRHKDAAVQTLLYPYELEVRLKSLMQTSVSAIEEMGANILYLALGFLEWYESTNNNSRFAPLFLVPARLQKGRFNPKIKTYEYTVSYSGEDIIPNLSLREKLRSDFAMELPDLDENTTPEVYFDEVLALVRENHPRWRLRRFITLTLLNFSKLLMYLDLDPSRWPEGKNIVEHPVVTYFLSGYRDEQGEEDGSNGDLGFGEEYPIDEIADVHAIYPLIDDADSSQHSALIDAVDGKNLVIEGPPGTGKSQTITNLIAAAMAQGKRVLFVAEKLAALEVVRRRLDAVGLGEFCLELHSHKSQKRKVIDEVDVRLKKRGRYRKPKDIEVDIERCEENKTELKNYAEKINQTWKKTGKTLHEIFTAATRYRNVIGVNPSGVSPEGYNGNNYDIVTQRRNEDKVREYCKVYQAISHQLDGDAALQEHPWYGVHNSELQIFDLDRVQESLGAWQGSLQQLSSERKDIARTLGCDVLAVAETLTEAQVFLGELESIPALLGDEILERFSILRGDVLEKTQRCLKLFEEIQELYTSLAKTVGVEILQDLAIVDQLISGSERLKKLVGRDVELGVLAKAINRLETIDGNLIRLYETTLHGVFSDLGEPAKKHLMVSESGLDEFKTAIEIIASLNAPYWKYRDELFDNEELDELLPQLRLELEELQGLHSTVRGVFSLENVPNEKEIRQLKVTLVSGGLFRWFKSSWRSAHKQLLSYSVNAQVYPQMVSSLDDLANFTRKLKKLEDNTRYKEALGGFLQGLDTNLAMLESLRAWYKRTRQKYGVGFGQKVALGDAILKLPSNIAKAVRSLIEHGVEMQINSLLDDLGGLQEIFAPVVELHNKNTLLIGEEGVIQLLLSEVNQAVQACGSLTRDDSLSMADLSDRIEQIGLLKQRVEKWQKANSIGEVFQGRLSLEVGVDVDNSAGLSMLRNTLKLASFVDGQLCNTALVDHIYDHPTEKTFLSLFSHAERLRVNARSQQNSYDAFTAIVHLNHGAWTVHSSDRIDDLIQRNQLALDKGETLQNWLDYVRVRDRLEALGLSKIANGVEQREFEIEQVTDIYQAGIFDVLAREILREDPELGRFSGPTQEALRDQFKKYDERLKKLQREKIAWQIDQNKVPAGRISVRVNERTELSLLEHECSKKKRHLPIRQLLHRASGALSTIKPCFMMGPMSVAQYLAPGQIEFDLVVMDEASQIKPQDALGAVSRGDQLVVVGDPKQLPPTSFFDHVIDDYEDSTIIEESESILDATLPMFPARRLRWHYRSQHEDLIAFSNHSFYESDLVLFPSPHKAVDGYGIRYERVPQGCFVDRRNMEEAIIISEAVREHFRHRSEESLGVVAMNAEQRLQIENSIDTLAKEDTVFQEWLDEDARKDEPLFIKNLENVQGDERDVIFISMTYGPQEPSGRVFQRFGPINSEVGWRRLNVLFTRSRRRMHIFSSMNSWDIVSGTTAKRGVQSLRDFLAFCETGILHRTERETGREPDSDFEIAVMTALKDEGFECVPQVGVAGFFIDVAVLDPGNPGRYLMGIECDGATYHSAKSTRDRDRLRQTILERLGWRIRRIWSTDWFKNPRAEIQPIIREINSIKTESSNTIKQ